MSVMRVEGFYIKTFLSFLLQEMSPAGNIIRKVKLVITACSDEFTHIDSFVDVEYQIHVYRFRVLPNGKTICTNAIF